MRALHFEEKIAYGRIVIGIAVLLFFGLAWNYWLAGAVLGGVLILGGISSIVGTSGCCRVDYDKINREKELKKAGQDHGLLETKPAPQVN